MQRDRNIVLPQLALSLLMLFHVGFWLMFGQLSQVVLAIVGKHGLLLIASLVAALAPPMLWLWALLGRHRLAPSTTAKFSLGFVLLAVSWFFVSVHFEWSRAPGPEPAPLIAICVLSLALAALCLGPASLTAIVELEAREHRVAWVAVWLLAFPFATGARSWIGASAALDERVVTCTFAGLLCVLAGVALAFVWHPITSLAAARSATGSEHEAASVVVPARGL
jgi:dipeptide/tripeptide permease